LEAQPPRDAGVKSRTQYATYMHIEGDHIAMMAHQMMSKTFSKIAGPRITRSMSVKIPIFLPYADPRACA
jgi:hypothetical protein